MQDLLQIVNERTLGVGSEEDSWATDARAPAAIVAVGLGRMCTGSVSNEMIMIFSRLSSAVLRSPWKHYVAVSMETCYNHHGNIAVF